MHAELCNKWREKKDAENMMKKMCAQHWSNKIAQETIEVIELSHSIATQPTHICTYTIDAVNDGISVHALCKI